MSIREINIILVEMDSVDEKIGNLSKELIKLSQKRFELEIGLADTVTLHALRPIEPRDVETGAMYFGQHSDQTFYMHYISEVYNPSLKHKAWLADDGCRYGLEGHYVLKKMYTKLPYEKWHELHEEQINIELAESGADREMCFDSEREFEKRYEKYLTE